MTPDEAMLLVDYHVWARQRLLPAVATLTAEQLDRAMGSSFGSVRETLVHLYGADEVWLSRWTGGDPRGLPPASRFPDLAALQAAWAELDPRLRTFVGGLGADGLARSLTYVAFNGKPATVAHAAMLQHLVNHGSYHRGQVTTLLRQLGAPPAPSMDLIVFHRERGA